MTGDALTSPGIDALQAWAHVRDTNSPGDLEFFLDKFGGSEFAPFAQARLLELKGRHRRSPPYQTCETATGDEALAACDRAIAGGKFSGRNLSNLSAIAASCACRRASSTCL